MSMTNLCSGNTDKPNRLSLWSHEAYSSVGSEGEKQKQINICQVIQLMLFLYSNYVTNIQWVAG